jgi:hypothetical protein
MRHYLGTALSVVVASLILAGCKGSDGSSGPQGPAGPALTGSIIGFAQLANEDHTYPTARNGISVTVTGTGVVATTDSSGKFTLNGLSTGTLDIVASKAGYADSKVQSVPFAGGGTMLLSSYWGTMTLDHLPAFEVATMTAAASAPNISVTGTINTTAAWYRYVLLYIGKTSAVSSNPATYKFSYSTYVNGSANTFNATIYKGNFDQTGFVSGDTVFVAAYSAGSQYYSSGSIDPVTGNYVYTSLGAVVKNSKAVFP